MGSLKTGAFLSSFRLGFRQSLEQATEIGLAGLQLSSLAGEIDVEKMTAAQAGEIRRLFGDYGLVISAVCGDIGGFAVEDRALAEERIVQTRRIMDNTLELGVAIVQTHIGFIPEDMKGPQVANMIRCLEEIGGYGLDVGLYLATETGPEPAQTMKIFLDRLAVPSIKVNYDPANLVMNGFDAIGGVRQLGDYIVHSHAKDGRREPDEMGRKEQPLGRGEVDFPAYIKAMEDIGYDGFYVIEREVGEDPAGDIREAAEFLSRF